MGVTATHEQYDAMSDDWRMMEDALVGPRAIKASGTAYLPKTSGMIEAESLAGTDNSPVSLEDARKLYLAYKDRADYPMWVKDSLRTMIGLVSRQEPEIALPERMKALEHEATADGFGLQQLFLRVVSALLTKGRKPLLVEFDDSGNPYIATYTAETATNWRTSDAGGRQDLALVVLKEPRLKGGDEFEPEYEDVYRVLDLVDDRYRVRVMREDGSLIGEEEFPGRVGGSQSTPLTFIPLVFAGSTDNSVDVDEIPLLTMAQSALMYYRLSADYYQSLHYTAHPQPVISGIAANEELRVTGPMAAWTLEKENAKAYYLEFTGAGIEATRKAMSDQRQAAAEAGAKVLDIGGQESGEARKARQSDQHSSLYSVCVTAAEAIEQSLRYVAEWMGISPGEVKFKVEPKFSKEEVDSAMLNIIHNVVMANNAPRQVLFEAIRKAGITDMSDEDMELLIEDGGSILDLPNRAAT
ncbi:DUF4055 domain-containing protein [Halomonas sp. McH1-25]|uniref:DUF4055 domain-containing protein n=1 Tax=unclassified Halomonas TaxID=2609666 RepID=UPI001EF6B861|nr:MULTISPECIES: DUF4055 domain-containing protein [unclassified Halomonas]MCG7598870.1 DUF4055 domain-containing protein [Halomonas sp. McH1-25]MCP1340833.1 DUF4055 domain-containing protein [Halomonas sp. FL8]MCP1361284.1 DUF4055 domain-containing protein [Halomonas sp. BBD45]MCP1363689.1 DUF4055 domain-containing protein [Halomonas sp. BBD48]